MFIYLFEEIKVDIDTQTNSWRFLILIGTLSNNTAFALSPFLFVCHDLSFLPIMTLTLVQRNRTVQLGLSQYSILEGKKLPIGLLSYAYT